VPMALFLEGCEDSCAVGLLENGSCERSRKKLFLGDLFW
jgi:hypothetical protein